jgi:hypothetical protein
MHSYCTGKTGLDTGWGFCENPASFPGTPFWSHSAMFRTIYHFGCKCRLACLIGFAAVLVCLGSSGCAKWNLRGEGWQDDSLSSSIRQSRPPAKEAEFWSFSNKARQIEADCGSQ